MMTQIRYGKQILLICMKRVWKNFLSKMLAFSYIRGSNNKDRYKKKERKNAIKSYTIIIIFRNGRQEQLLTCFFTSERMILSLPCVSFDVTFNPITDKEIAAGRESAIKAAEIACPQAVGSLSRNTRDPRCANEKARRNEKRPASEIVMHLAFLHYASGPRERLPPAI